MIWGTRSERDEARTSSDEYKWEPARIVQKKMWARFHHQRRGFWIDRLLPSSWLILSSFQMERGGSHCFQNHHLKPHRINPSKNPPSSKNPPPARTPLWFLRKNEPPLWIFKPSKNPPLIWRKNMNPPGGQKKFRAPSAREISAKIVDFR